jgi:hypothetical protein
MAIEPDYAATGGIWNDSFRGWEWRDEHGQLHRADGPAVIYPNGSQVWYLHGQRHRIDGHAVIWASGTQSWYVQGQDITAEVLDWMDRHGITLPFNEAQQVEFALRWL